MKNYRALFAAAAARTQKYGLQAPDVKYDSRLLLTPEFHRQFPHLLLAAVGEIGLDELVGQCLSIHYRLRETMAQMLKSEVYFTLGWVRMEEPSGKETRLFEFDDKWIEQRLAKGNAGKHTADLHAWLTLPSMEILDLSLSSSIAVMSNIPEGRGGVIANHADSLVNGVSYVPMLIGEDFLRRAGMIGEILVME